MFLYWKKRGAYELESLPPSFNQVGIERYSWSSSLDVIHDLCGKLGGRGVGGEGHLTMDHMCWSVFLFQFVRVTS